MQIQTLSCLLALATTVTAQDASQSASGARHFLASFEFGAGGRCVTSTHVLVASLGAGVTAQRASTSRHVLTGGFNATLDISTTGKPWLSAVTPPFTAMRSGATVTIHGTDLLTGTAVEVGGQPATILGRAPDKITLQLPNQSAPGFRPVTVTTTGGATTLPQGLGVLPLIQEKPAAASDVPFALVFRGTKGDQVIWAIGVQPIFPLKINSFLHGLAINPSLILVVPGFHIPTADGVVELSFPAQTYATGSIYAQALFISSNPAYAPGAFSNVVQL